MGDNTKVPDGEHGLRQDQDESGEQRQGRQAQDEEGAHRKETFTKEPLEGEPGYGEPPPEVRKDKLPDQGW
ncbi:hypothetical protein FGE12_02570 [Aggregicoccus sp. 17bor-14]|uniref:hypothetical protein n=1 Tax=Myxococcaceae TaxID=31 RepID=UPI00129C37DC|nr:MULTISPECIES: hypothetical protein [Myxococcaceae]MBF5041255.1 hypothetical protein [Simulacricoccus sp. 17bor-14]MRI87041.1 hypothetical protein [Aggregicoccus sp. 17bor-14]